MSFEQDDRDLLQAIHELPGAVQEIRVILTTLSDSMKNLSAHLELTDKRLREDINKNRSDIAMLNATVAKFAIDISAMQTWQLNHDRFRCPFVGSTYAQTLKLALERLISKHFNRNEVDGLAHEIGIDPDEIEGNTKEKRIVYLIGMMERRNRLHHLISHCMRLRPAVQWPEAP